MKILSTKKTGIQEVENPKPEDQIVITVLNGDYIDKYPKGQSLIDPGHWAYLTNSHMSACEAFFLANDEIIEKKEIVEDVIYLMRARCHSGRQFYAVFIKETFQDFCARCPEDMYVRADGDNSFTFEVNGY